MSWVSTPPGYDYHDEQDTNTNGHGNGNTEEDEEGEEPWLDTPERLRLILGLVAEFTEGSVSKVESEVGPSSNSKGGADNRQLGKLLVSPIWLDGPEESAAAITPAVRPPASSSFLLVLNGTSKSEWAVLSAKVSTRCGVQEHI